MPLTSSTSSFKARPGGDAGLPLLLGPGSGVDGADDTEDDGIMEGGGDEPQEEGSGDEAMETLNMSKSVLCFAFVAFLVFAIVFGPIVAGLIVGDAGARSP
jgi:hypothetical protein